MASHDGFGTAKPIEVFAYDENDTLDKELSAQLQTQVQDKVNSALEGLDWEDE